MNTKKGLSQVVTTVIFVGLAIIAIGIVWAVISNLINEGASTTEAQAKCLSITVRATSVIAIDGTNNYNVTLRREAGGGAIEGVKLVISRGTDNSPTNDTAKLTTPITDIAPLASLTAKDVLGVANANKIEVTPYVKDDSGKDVLCTSTEFNF